MLLGTGTRYIFTSLLFVPQAGIYWVNLIDHFCAGWGILIAAVLEIIGIIYIYGKLFALKIHDLTMQSQTQCVLNINYRNKAFIT